MKMNEGLTTSLLSTASNEMISGASQMIIRSLRAGRALSPQDPPLRMKPDTMTPIIQPSRTCDRTAGSIEADQCTGLRPEAGVC